MVFPSQPEQRSAFRLIERSDLPGLTFPEADVVSAPELRQERWCCCTAPPFKEI